MTTIVKLSEIISKQAIVNMGTAGHVAHGKTTITRDLTGKKTLRHSSELKHGTTINLGYANCKIFKCMKTGKLYPVPSETGIMYSPEDGEPMKLIHHISFVDCPGHENYMATMIGGSSIMDSCLFLIAANEMVPMPQTLDHLITLCKTDIKELLILQNKVDLLSKEDVKENYNKIQEFIAGSPFEKSEIIPISAQLGWNIEQVCKYIFNIIPKKLERINEPARLSILRSFDINYPNIELDTISGGVIGGSLIQGNLMVGDIIEIRPGNITRNSEGEVMVKPILAKVVTLNSEKSPLDIAVPGGLVGIGLSIDPSLTKNNKLIGHMAGLVGTLPPIYDTLTISLTKIANRTNTRLKLGEKICIVVNSKICQAEITEIEQSKNIVVKMEHPVCLTFDNNLAVFRKIDHSFKLAYFGKIIDGDEFTNIIYSPKYELYQNQERVIELVNDLEWETVKLETYDNLFDNIDKTEAKKANKIISPEIEYENRATKWSNFSVVIESILNQVPENPPTDFEIKHITSNVLDKMKTPWSINAENCVIIKGKISQFNVIKEIKEYIANYRMCKQCKKVLTSLSKQGKGLEIKCHNCTSITCTI
jgi:translation initiation factor 2 subunit 3